MKPDLRVSICTYSLLLLAGAVSFTLPERLTVSTSYGAAAGDQFMLTTIVRDFTSSHVDFDVLPSLGYGHDAHLIIDTIGPDRRPKFRGAGIVGAAAGGTVVSGDYLGNGADNRAFTGVGFTPTLLIIKADDGEPVVCRTATMSGDASKEMADDTATFSNRIQSLDAAGFTIGSDNDVNESGTSYHWTAFAAKAGEIAAGSFVGDDTDDRTITGLGFDPDLVIVFPEGSRYPYHRSSVMPAGQSFRFNANSASTNRIQDLVTDGFEIGDDDHVNKAGETFHYVAWKAIAGEMAVGNYAGDGNDNRAIIGLGFQPAYAFIKSSDSKHPLHRTASVGSGDQSLQFADSSNVADGIQKLLPNGFEIGGRDEVNDSGRQFYWSAFRSNGAVMHDDDGSDEASGGGFRVTSEWTDAAGRPIAPHLAGTGGVEAFTEFQVSGQTIVPQRDFAVMVTCLGAAISGSYHDPVTAKVRIGALEFEPFGPFSQPVEGNVNDNESATGNANPGSNPREIVLSQTFSAGDAISVVGRNWNKIDDSDSGLLNSHWTVRNEHDSQAGSAEIIMLRDGDDIPSYAPLHDQAGLEAFIASFIDVDAGKMTMCDNQVIFLFELGTDATSSSADFQDLVLLVTFADSDGDLPPPPNCALPAEDVCGTAIADADGAYGAPSDAGITDEASFDQWFADVDGVNDSMSHIMTMVENGSGIYEYLSNAFYPIDDLLLGNEGQANNNLFTLTFSAKFTYEQCTGQFIQFEGADDAWVFIDPGLVIDLGGIQPGTGQAVYMDRRDLIDGEKYTVHFFFANRTVGNSVFKLRTNMELDQSDFYPSVGSMFD